MLYREFGSTGIKISALGFGAMRLPGFETEGMRGLDTEKCISIIHRAFELGVNYIDTAPYYGQNESEIVVGKALKGWRDKVYLSSKNPLDDNSGDHWREWLEKSLRRLDTDYIDFYHMWGINWEGYRRDIDVPNGPMSAAFKAKEEGLIRHISFSFHGKSEDMIKLADTGNFETVLCQYNLLDRGNENSIAYAKEKGLGVVIMGPVGGGRLGAPSKTISGLLPGKLSSSAEIALRFVFANPNVSCVLSGMSTFEMVEENAAIASNGNVLSQEELKCIKTSMAENKRRAELYCTGCNYCMPCPTGVNIPLNFEIMNYHRIYGLTGYAREQYNKIGTEDELKGKKADACLECGICEAKCPQKIHIRQQLKETARALGQVETVV